MYRYGKATAGKCVTFSQDMTTVFASASSKGRGASGSTSCNSGACAARPCANFDAVCTAPCIPPQGAIMPVLYNPGNYTNLHAVPGGEPVTYTLNVLTTVSIAVGTLFRFQFFDGCNATLSQTYPVAFVNGDIVQIDIVVSKEIPVGTIVVVAITDKSASLLGFSGSAVYGVGNSFGDSDPLGFFLPNATCLCWAFVPTATNAFPHTTWVPTAGQPMFTIGFNFQVPATDTACPATGALTDAQLTAPNVPDQWSLEGGPSWTWLYNVVFPIQYNIVNPANPTTGTPQCVNVTGGGIKIDDAFPIYVPGSWTAARDIIAQPWTALQVNSRTPTRWRPYNYALNGEDVLDTPAVGPFLLAAEPGQLAVVYFRPRQQFLDCNPDLVSTTLIPATAGPWIADAQLGLLVTSPLPPRSTLYFTVEPYNEALAGFGPANPMAAAPTVCDGGTAFVTHTPAFEWVTGSCVVPAGTVVFIDHIGSATQDPVIVDAHDTGANRVGSIVRNTLTTAAAGGGSAVPSIAIVSDWVSNGVGAPRPLATDRFVTAVLSDQYTGDVPPLSPSLTMPATRAPGAVGYGLRRVIDAGGMPGTVQAALINGGSWTQIPDGAEIGPADMPVFLNLQSWAW